MKVKFLPTNEEFEIKPNETVLHLAQTHNIHIQSVCKGLPSCTECRIHVVEGDYNVIPPSHTEKSLIGNSYYIDGRRLSCQLRCFGDITVDLREQLEKVDRAAKKPRGKVVRQAEESKAVLGSLILEGGDDKSETPLDHGDDDQDALGADAVPVQLEIESATGPAFSQPSVVGEAPSSGPRKLQSADLDAKGPQRSQTNGANQPRSGRSERGRGRNQKSQERNQSGRGDKQKRSAQGSQPNTPSGPVTRPTRPETGPSKKVIVPTSNES